jgi:hypothetical protein
MGMSSNLMPGIIALVAIGVVQLATALPQIELNNGGLQVPGSRADCEAVATALNSLKFGSSGVECTGINPSDYTYLKTDEPKDVELLNTLLAFSVKGYSDSEVSIAADLANMKN